MCHKMGVLENFDKLFLKRATNIGLTSFRLTSDHSSIPSVNDSSVCAHERYGAINLEQPVIVSEEANMKAPILLLLLFLCSLSYSQIEGDPRQSDSASLSLHTSILRFIYTICICSPSLKCILGRSVFLNRAQQYLKSW